MKRLQHPRHGFGFAMNAIEEATMRANGWTDESGSPKSFEDSYQRRQERLNRLAELAGTAAAPQEDEQQATTEAQAPEGVAPARKKPGPKPKA